MPLTSRDFTNPEVVFLDNLAKTIGLESDKDKWGGSDTLSGFENTYFSEPSRVIETDLPFFPSGEVLSQPNPGFTQSDISPSQTRAYNAARTRTNRMVEDLTMAGRSKEASQIIEADKPSTMGTAFEGFGDLLQIGQFTTVGLIDEWLRTGNFGKAMEQASIEFANALPGIELEEARRPGYADVLRQLNVFPESAAGRYATSGLGFVLDVAADPTTWFGFGVGKLFNAARKTANAPALVDALAKRGVPLTQGFGEKFLPSFDLKQFAMREGTGAKEFLGETGEKVVQGYLEKKAKYFAEVDQGYMHVHDVVSGLATNMTKDQRQFFTLFLDQGDEKFRKMIKTHLMARGGNVDQIDEVMEKADAFRNAWREWGEQEVKEGVLSPSVLYEWDRYVPGRDPLTKGSRREWKDFISRNNPEGKINVDDLRALDPVKADAFMKNTGLIGTEVPAFAREKTFTNIIDRIVAGIPTELDIVKSTTKRGMESERARATRRMLKSVMNDPSLVRKFDPEDGGALFKDPKFLTDLDNRGYVVMHPEKLKEYQASDLKIMGDSQIWDDLLGNKPGPVVMPKAIFEDLQKANKFWKDEDHAMAGFVKSFQSIQNLWKGYALLSPGYHLRNQYSNVFQNWLAGVTHPKRYAMSMALQAKGTENLPVVVREGVEMLLGGRKHLDDVWMTTKGTDGAVEQWTGNRLLEQIEGNRIFSSGAFSKDLVSDIETHMLTGMERGIKKASFHGVSKAAEGFRRKLIAAGIEEPQADATTRIWDATAKTWAIQNQRSVDDYWRKFGPEVRYNNADEFHPQGYTLYQRGKAKEPAETFRKAPWDAPDLPHGNVEDGLYEVFKDHPNPTADILRKTLGAPTRRDMRRTTYRKATTELTEKTQLAAEETGIDFDPWSWDFRDLREILDYALEHGGTEYQWYKKFGQNMSEMVGEKNMAEFSGVYSITSAHTDLETNFLNTIGVMRVAREIYRDFGEFNVAEFQKRLSRETDVDEYNKINKAEGLPELQPGETVMFDGRPITLDREMLQAKKLENLGDDSVTMRPLGMTKDMEKKLVELYEHAHFKGDMKTVTFALNNYQQAKGAGFFPFTVNDRHIARLLGIYDPKGGSKGKGEFGFSLSSKKGQNTYRWVQYQLAQLSHERKDLLSPDEVQAALWWYAKKYLSPANELGAKVGDAKVWRETVGDLGTFASSATYAKPELLKLRTLQESLGDDTGGLYKGLPGFEKMDIAYSRQARQIDELIPLNAEEAQRRGEIVIVASSKAGLVTLEAEDIVRHGGFAIKDVADAPWEKSVQFHNEFFTRATDGEGAKYQWLAELESILGAKHHVNRDALGTWNGLEPNFSVTVVARDDATASAIAAILGDGMKQDIVVWYRPQRFTPDEAKRMMDVAGKGVSSVQAIRFRRKDGNLFTVPELKDVAAKLNPLKDEEGVQFTAEPGLGAARIFNFSGVEDVAYFAPILKTLKQQGYTQEHFTHVGAYHGKEDYAGVIAGIRGSLARGPAGPSDMARRIYDSFHKPYIETLRRHFARSTGGDIYEEELTRGVSKALEGLTDPTAQATKTLFQNHGTLKKGAVEFNDEASDIINIFETGDFSTIVHESAHIFRRRIINEEDMSVVERWAKVKDGNWTVDKEERFAEAFEEYLLEGRAPITGLRSVFAKAKDWMGNLYETLSPLAKKGGVKMDDDIRGVFDRLLGKNDLEPLGEEAAKHADMARGVGDEVVGIGDRIQDVGGFLSKWFGQHAPQMRWNRVAGKALENNARGAHWLDKLEKTGDTSVATGSVNKYLFDYEHGLTTFERDVMRTVIPFYSWMRFNMPLQLTAMLEDPGRYAKVPKAIQAIEDITSEWRDIPTPDHFKEMHAIRMPFIMNAKPTYLNPNFPFQDLNRMNWQDIVNSMTPFAKVLGEWAPRRGYSFFLNRPIERYEGEESEVIPGLRKKDENVLMTMLPTLGKAQRLGKAFKRDELSAQILTEIAGIKLMNADPQRVLRGHTYAVRDALDGLVKRMEAAGTLPPIEQRRPRKPRRLRRGRKKRTRKLKRYPQPGQISAQTQALIRERGEE